MLGDMTRLAFSDAAQQKLIAAYAESAGRTVNAEMVSKDLQRKGLLDEKGRGALLGLLNSDNTEILPTTPERNSALRFSQALSFIAQQKAGDRRIEIEEAAGEYVPVKVINK